MERLRKNYLTDVGGGGKLIKLVINILPPVDFSGKFYPNPQSKGLQAARNSQSNKSSIQRLLTFVNVIFEILQKF